MSAKAKKEPRSENVGVMVTPSVKAELLSIAGQDERSLSQVTWVLLMRGLEGFRKDGQLRPRGKGGKDGLDVIRAKTDEEPRRKLRP